ncbi:Oxalate:formate antiporter [Candidatus Izimaplasma bacterium HR1]|jgi:MFS family permease|uniref:OFA family MFS transporter n=1 Tax=Candidatus Izimoplasma sp. HR1 TaxID=1541959 RepID=UPI0004F92DA3|nr:Oxalate:formate antiporter [Candidatus Izimaplasma bacterium HR1]
MLKKQLQYVVIGTMLMLLLGIVYSYSMFRLELETTLNISKFASGVPYMIALFFFSLFMAIGGILYSRFNTRLIASIGVILISLGFVLSSQVNSIFLITITYGVIVGTGVGILYGLPLRIVPQLDYHNTGLLTGIVLLGFGLSPLVFAPLINSLIINQGLSVTFLYLGISYLILTIPLILVLSSRDTQPKNKDRLEYSIIKNKKFISLYILFFLGTFIGLTFIGFTGNIGKELIGIDQNAIAILLGLFAIFNGLGRPLFGYLHDRIGFKKSAIISFITLIFATLLHYTFSTSYFIFIVSFILFYLNFGGWLSLAPSTTIELFGKKDYSKNFGLMYTAYGVGAIFGNSIGGYLVESLGLRSIFLLMSFISVLGLIFVKISFKDYKKE